MSRKHLVFDTETTGLIKHPAAKDAVQPAIIEWAGVLVDGAAPGEVLRSFSALINPRPERLPLEPVITKITGITDADLEGQPVFADLVDTLRSFFAEADVLVAHNLPFDRGLMELELGRVGLLEDWPWPEVNVCTVQEHVEEFGRRMKLLELFEHYTGRPLAQTHRALDDVEALVTVCDAAGVFGGEAS